ncbi:Mitochondrial presequence protease [Taphrina deformans PYCC 5710]|uniref:Presequence protease, mitochondrial n=1 Tax=Taphrina deformans (strain PYCC 5710 / ATCC 11124 / CBS 356.35 / IMI 108563 / JCM 9778 / NBRC 8474) TaxID=1097556 RepID=R4XAD4_TAPDE|nr:Mitochondrial presequence protease [Taphrina deformans PYCC 5710]|eukprot:CCG82467.1 Mitochondrial presequence protease [Taphrina deformans PYCC 5710]
MLRLCRSPALRIRRGVLLDQRAAIHGFTIQRTKSVPELQLEATLLKHDKTGLEHLHIARDDPNNVFSIGFATPPTDSTGVPHILEHTTLCGSEKYPVRDPFFKMLNRSLATYMNAFTASDYTFYPFATVNQADHANLRDVYLDATLFPRLREIDFLQEGWRLEHKDPKDFKTEIEYKGVVYNEMKGQMSDASYLFYIMFQREMYRGTIYGNDSGGDPKNIPDLSYAQLLAFHQRHYHPSNSKVFTYGSFPLDEQLESLNAKLMAFSATPPSIISKAVDPWTSYRQVEVEGPHDPLAGADQIKTSVSFLCNDVADTFETFSLRILSSLLLDGHSAPLYKGLIESELGSDFSPNTGYDNSTKTAVMSVGLQGVSEQNLNKIRPRIQEILQGLANDGFAQDKVDGILHQMEIALKRKSANFGMSLLNSVASGWFNDVDPLALLAWNETVDRFKQNLASGNYMGDLIRKYLLKDDNAGVLGFTMRPSSDFASQLAKAETEKLNSAVSSLTEGERVKVQENGLALLKFQNAEENLDCLPTLRVSDIPKTVDHTRLELGGAVKGVSVDWNFKATGITYFRMIAKLKALPEELRPYLPLFTDCFTNLGTKKCDMATLEDAIRLKTGGISVGAKVSTHHSDMDKFEEGIAVTGHCLDQNLSSMFHLIRTIITETDFDNTDKLRQLLRMNASGIVSNVAESGHSYARTYAASLLTPAGEIAETHSGLSQVKLVSALANEADLSIIISKLKRIKECALQQDSLRCFVTTDPNNTKHLETELSQLFVAMAPGNQIEKKASTFQSTYPSKAFFPLPYSVNFAALSMRGVPYTHRDGAALQVLAKLLTNKHLHREIREKGGAYGGGATFSATSGIFGYYSYRDPNTLKTLQTMEDAGAWAVSQSWANQDLEEAKLSIFQGVDAPISVASEGMVYFTERITAEMRQQRREQLLAVNSSQIREVAEKYLVQSVVNEQTSVAILGEKPDWIEMAPNWKLFNWATEAQKVTEVAEGLGDVSIPIETTKLDNSAKDHPREINSSMQTTDTHGQLITNVRKGDDGEILTIEITERAQRQLRTVLEKRKESDLALRLALESGGCHGYQYAITLTNEIEVEEDVIFEKNGARVVIDEGSLAMIDGSKLDYTMELIGSEFKITDNPRAVSKCGCDTSIDIDIGVKKSKND